MGHPAEYNFRVSNLLSMTVRVLSMIARAVVEGSVSAVMFHGWWILGIVAAVAIVGVVIFRR
ncbi:MAG: hypothetical protein ABSE92_08260 [Terriglobales bacterium]|jgi:hypothetical protein